jgi:hypothetical protein
MEISNTLIIKSESEETLKKIHSLFVNKIINKDYSDLFAQEPTLVSALTAGQQEKVRAGKLSAGDYLNCGAMFDDESGYDNSFEKNLGEHIRGKFEKNIDLLTLNLTFDSKSIIDKLVKLVSKAYQVVIYQEWEDLNGLEAGFQHFMKGRKEWPYHYGTKVSMRISKYTVGSSNVLAQRRKITLEYLLDEYNIIYEPENFHEMYQGECDEYLDEEDLSKIEESLESDDWEWFEKIVFSE